MHPTDVQDANATTARFERIAAMHREDAQRLERRVARQARADPQTIEDACSFAWLQLLTHTSIDPGPAALGWLTQTATREAWRLAARRVRDELMDHRAIEDPRLREQTGPGVDQLAAQHARLELVAEVPQRPRRFVMRLALGYSYREIAAHECVSLTTANRQIARGKRLLRKLEAPVTSLPSGAAGRPGGTRVRAPTSG